MVPHAREVSTAVAICTRRGSGVAIVSSMEMLYMYVQCGDEEPSQCSKCISRYGSSQ